MGKMKDMAAELNYIAECLTVLEDLFSMPSCQDCAAFVECEYRPGWGERVRFNCPLHVPKKEATRHEG